MRNSRKKCFGRLCSGSHRFVRIRRIIVVQSSKALGVCEASCKACIPITPATSTSHALERPWSLIMLMTVQGTTPKYSSSEVQH